MNADGTVGMKLMKVYVHRVSKSPEASLLWPVFQRFFLWRRLPHECRSFSGAFCWDQKMHLRIFSSSEVPRRPFLPFGKLGSPDDLHICFPN